MGIAEDVGQTEHLGEQDAERGTELEQHTDRAADLHWRELIDVHRAQARVEATVEADDKAARHDHFERVARPRQSHEQAAHDAEHVVQQQTLFSSK